MTKNNQRGDSFEPVKPRQEEIRFFPIDKTTFCWFLSNRGLSEIGPVGSQYEKAIKDGSSKVGIYGLYLCDTPIGVRWAQRFGEGEALEARPTAEHVAQRKKIQCGLIF